MVVGSLAHVWRHFAWDATHARMFWPGWTVAVLKEDLQRSPVKGRQLIGGIIPAIKDTIVYELSVGLFLVPPALAVKEWPRHFTGEVGQGKEVVGNHVTQLQGGKNRTLSALLCVCRPHVRSARFARDNFLWRFCT